MRAGNRQTDRVAPTSSGALKKRFSNPTIVGDLTLETVRQVRLFKIGPRPTQSLQLKETNCPEILQSPLARSGPVNRL